MIAYISQSLTNRKMIYPELTANAQTIIEFQNTPFIFVDQYKFGPSQERQMMHQAMTDIDKCELFIAEVSDKAIGIGVEAGYAKAMGKPIVYVRKAKADHSTTVSGVSDFQVIYNDVLDLQKQLASTLRQVKMMK